MRILPLLMDENSDRLLKEEISNNSLFQVNSQKARERFAAEFRRRYNAVSFRFWERFLSQSESAQKISLLYAILRAYKLIFDFHFNVTVKHWNSIERTLRKSDIMMEFYELSAKDPYVEGWTDNTKNRCASQYLTILRQVGMLDPKTDELRSVKLQSSDYEYYFRSGEEWFLEACLLYPYEIAEIKSSLL